jgi:hypothetical protein
MEIIKLPLVFVHLPKTAGTFVRSVLNSNYEDVQSVYTTPPFKPLRNMSHDEKELILKADVVIGHVSVYEFSTELHSDLKFYTVLRNPVDRVISYYNHMMTHNELYKTKKLSPLSYLENSNDYQLDNLQLRYLSGNPVKQSVGEPELEKAISMIKSGRIIPGIKEDMQRTFRSLLIFRGANASDYPERNKSSFGFSRASMTDAEIDAFRQHNALDMKLYSYCRNAIMS